jgi:DNA-binding response OmpR family regulator
MPRAKAEGYRLSWRNGANLAESEGNAMRESNLASAPWRTALTASPVHTPARILVAEDDEGMRSAVVETLRNDGYQVSEASDGGRLLVAIAREYLHVEGTDLIDLLVSDVRMPVCTGLQILEQMRAASSSLPVILMTAFGDESMRKQALLLGAVLFDKPFDIDDLRTAVACLLRREPKSEAGEAL